MTRKEQIEAAHYEWAKEIAKRDLVENKYDEHYLRKLGREPFFSGAEWADANPLLNKDGIEALAITIRNDMIELLEEKFVIAFEALRDIAEDKLGCKKLGLNWEGYRVLAEETLAKISEVEK